MPLSEADKKRRAQRKWDRNRPASVQNRNRQNTLSNYHARRQRETLSAIDALAAAGGKDLDRCNYHRAKRQRKSLEAIDARAAAGATSLKRGLQALSPFQKSQNNPSLFR